MKNLKEKITILMPAYNEAETIRKSLDETIRTFDDFGCDYEILVIDDGSSDNTLAEALKVADGNSRVRVKRNLENFGKGRALKKAFRHATGEYIVFLDSDLDLHPGQVQTLFDIMRLDEADIVIGSKFHPNSSVEYPPSRRFISLIYYFVTKVLFCLPVRDTQTGLKLFKAHVLREVFPKILVKSFAYDLEILANAHRLGYKIAEAPIVIEQKRKYGRIGYTSIWQTAWDTLAVFYRMYILKYYDQVKEDKKDV
jgi:glycosyltransferase involved in cell wall biosynthesis